MDLHEKKNEQTEGSHRIRQTQTLQSEGYCASATNAPSSKRDLEMMEEVTIKTKKKRDSKIEKKSEYSGYYCRTHFESSGPLPLVGCYEMGGHIGPPIGSQYKNEQVKIARLLQKYFDEMNGR